MSEPLTGVTSTGFVRQVAADIKTDLEDARDDEHGQVMRRDGRSVAGQQNGVLTGSFDALWKLLETLAKSRGPRSAGFLLDEIAGMTETVRKPATASTLDSLVLTGTLGTVVPALREATSPDGVQRYKLDVDSPAFVAATAWAATAAVALGAFRAASGGIYVALVAGTTGSTAPSGTERVPVAYTDGTVTWGFVGPGTAYAAECAATATETGPVGGPAFGISAIGISAAGWAGVSNLRDALLGREVERDDQLRVRRRAELHAFSAKATPDAIRGALLKLLDVTEAVVEENVEHTESPDGLPPHSFESIVEGSATDEAIGNVILRTAPAGIKSHGNTAVVVTDSRGFAKTRRYTNPVDLPIYLIIQCEVVRGLWPSEALADQAARGSGRAKAAALAYGQTDLSDGRDLDPRAVGGAVFRGEPDPAAAAGTVFTPIPGLLNCRVLAGLAPSPTLENRIEVTPRQRARLDSSRIQVAVTYRTP